jgi:hypothetical protein
MDGVQMRRASLIYLNPRLLEQAQARIQAEEQDTGVEEQDTDCPICFDCAFAKLD